MENTIKIEKVSESNLSVLVNGEVKEIRNQLDELKTLIRNQNVNVVQYADKIYNIEHINEANFGLLTGKQAFNEVLTKNLIEAIVPYSPDAKILVDYMQKQQVSDWAKQEKYAKKAKEILAYSYVGVIGMQLSHLIGIGNNKNLKAEDKLVPYIEKCLHVARYSLDLLCFAFVSQLWDVQKKQTVSINATQSQQLHSFFERKFEPEFSEQLLLLQELWEVFQKNQISLPFEEMKGLESQLQRDSALWQSCQKLQALKKLASEKYTFVECATAEFEVSQVMTFCSFLANYNMASIKKVGYKYLRNTAPHFIHNYIELGFDQKANPDVEKHKYTTQDIATDTVLIYQGDNYATSINLFPFVIDYNALTFEQGPKIYFYQSLDFSNENILEYILLKDDEISKIEFKNVLHTHTNLNEVVGDTEKLRDLNLDHILLQFREAKKTLTENTETDADFDNLFKAP